jgi:hypothetical protein
MCHFDYLETQDARMLDALEHFSILRRPLGEFRQAAEDAVEMPIETDPPGGARRQRRGRLADPD